MTKPLFCLLFAIAPFTIQAQTIHGIVYSENEKTPLEYATVSLLHLPDSAIISGSNTQAGGKFLFEQVKPGDYYLKASLLGYQPSGKTLRVSVNNPVIQADTIFLSVQSKQINEVTVKGARIEAKELVDRTVYTIPSEISKTSSTGFEILKKIPSVQVDFNNNVTLNGSTNFLIQVDGKIRDKEFLAKLLPTDIESVEVINSPSGKYEGNIDGIINVVLKKEARVGISGNISGGGRTYKEPSGSVSGSLDYGLSKVSFYVTGYSFFQRLKVDGHNYYSDDTTVRDMYGNGTFKMANTSVNTGFDYYLNDKNNLSFNMNYRPIYQNIDVPGLGTLVRKNVTDSLTERTINKTTSSEENISLFYKKTYKKPVQELTSEIRFYDFHNNLDNTTTSSDPGANNLFTNLNDRNAYTLKVDYVQPIGISARIETGYQFYYQDLKIGFLENNSDNTFKYNELRNSAYGGIIINTKKWGLQANIRLENSYISYVNAHDPNYTTPLPSANIQYKISSKQNLKLNYNRRIVRPGIEDLNPYIKKNTYIETEGNPDLKPEYYNKLLLTYTLNFGKNYVSPSIYYEFIDNKKGILNLQSSDGSGLPLTQPYNLLSGNERGFGLNAMLWFLNINARFFQGHFNGNNSGVVPIPPRNYSSFAINSYVFAPLPWKVNAFAFINYNGPSTDAQSVTYSTPFYGLGAQKIAGDHTIGFFYLLPLSTNITMSKTTTKAPPLYSENSFGFNVSYFIMVQYTYKFNKGKAVKKIAHKEELESDTKTGGIGK